MATNSKMTFDEIFSAYYSLYRADSDTPISSDTEYIVGMRLANEAINYWSNFDGTYWKELFDTNLNDLSGTQTISTGTTTYSAPTNFREAGGQVRLKDSSGNVTDTYPIVESNEVQFLGTDSKFCYFTSSPRFYSTGTASQTLFTITGVGTTWTSAMVGMEFVFATGETATITAFLSATSLTVSVSQTVASTAYHIDTTGFKLRINPAPTSSINGRSIDYTYYKNPTQLTTGVSRTEMANPYFIVHRMLGMQYRSSRNPHYSSAINDSENAIKVMQIDNNSGTWANPWAVADNSGTVFGG